MIRSTTIALFSALALLTSPATAGGQTESKMCTKTCEHLPVTIAADGATVSPGWVALSRQQNITVEDTYKCFPNRGIIEGPCYGLYVQCTPSNNYDGRVCQFRGLVRVVHKQVIRETVAPRRVEHRRTERRRVVKKRTERRRVEHRRTERRRVVKKRRSLHRNWYRLKCGSNNHRWSMPRCGGRWPARSIDRNERYKNHCAIHPVHGNRWCCSASGGRRHCKPM